MTSKTSQYLFLAVVAFFILILTAPVQAAEYVSVKKDGVNIRSGPSTSDKVVWQVFESFPLKVVERKGQWAHVEDFEGDNGWIYETLLSSQKTVIVKVDTANMRAGSSTDDPVIATVKKGVVFDVVQMKGDWVKVNYKDELTGWMHNSLIWPDNPL